MQTQINQAQIGAPVVINNAMAKVNASIVTNQATMESFVRVTKTEVKSYGMMKKKLSFKTDDEFLKYIRVKTINSFNQKNMLIGVIEVKTTQPKVLASDPSTN